jgi:hypothetical protein
LDRWTARKIPPIVVLYVVLVFVGFMLVSFFVFHSTEAVKALLIATVGAVAATVPGVIERVEYRATDAGIENRPVKKHQPREFETVFSWDELDRVVPMRHGFKYFKRMDEQGSLREFWNTHISDRYSGEVHVEREDLDRVLELVGRMRNARP